MDVVGLRFVHKSTELILALFVEFTVLASKYARERFLGHPVLFGGILRLNLLHQAHEQLDEFHIGQPNRHREGIRIRQD